MATHSSTLAWRIPTDRGTWWGTIHGVAKSQIWLKRLSTYTWAKLNATWIAHSYYWQSYGMSLGRKLSLKLNVTAHHSVSWSCFSGFKSLIESIRGSQLGSCAHSITVPQTFIKWENDYSSKEEISSVQFSRSVMSDSSWPHELQHARPPCPSPTPRVHPNPWPLSQWCHPTTSSSVIPFSSCPQSFPESGSFQMSQFFTSGGKVLEFKPAHKWSNDFQQRTKVIQWGKNNFATNGARIIEYSYVRM